MTSEALRCFTPAEMLALYSCMCTYIYPAYIIHYCQVKCFLLLTKKFLLDKIEISDFNPNRADWGKWHFHLLMKSLFWQYQKNPLFKEKTFIFLYFSQFFSIKNEKTHVITLPYRFSYAVFQVLMLGKKYQ